MNCEKCERFLSNEWVYVEDLQKAYCKECMEERMLRMGEI